MESSSSVLQWDEVSQLLEARWGDYETQRWKAARSGNTQTAAIAEAMRNTVEDLHAKLRGMSLGEVRYG